MPRRSFKFLFLVGLLIFTANVKDVFSQCGLPGTPPCRPPNSGGNSAEREAEKRRLARIEKERLARERAERGQAERDRLRRRKLAATVAKTSGQNQPVLNLFPVLNVTLGKTTAFELAKAGESCEEYDEKGDPKACYLVSGVYIYYNQRNLAESLYISKRREGGMPEEWKKLGFDWNLSFNGWLQLLKEMGYSPIVSKKPTVGKIAGQQVLNGEILTVVITGSGALQMSLNFNHGYGKTSPDDPSTLFAIDMSRIE